MSINTYVPNHRAMEKYLESTSNMWKSAGDVKEFEQDTTAMRRRVIYFTFSSTLH